MDRYFPHFIIGDEGFKLLPHSMKSYPTGQSETDAHKTQYNYRFSPARITVDSAFGMMSDVFRFFLHAYT